MMDIDFELDETDRINEFLNNKLSEIKSINRQLEESLKQRTETKLKCRQSTSAERKRATEAVSSLFTKISNGKYVLGYRISTGSDRCCISAVLNWDAASELNYQLHHHPSSNCHIFAITLDLPDFVDQLVYSLSGLVTVTLPQLGKKVSLRLPVTELRPEDVADGSKLVQMYRIIDGDLDDFMACLFSCEKCELDLVYPANGLRVLDTLLELDCCLARVKETSSRKFFLVHKISPLFDGSLVEIESEEEDYCKVNIFYRTEESLLALVHYLHRHLINASILPRGSYQKLDLDLEERSELLKKAVFEEIELVNGMLSESATKSDLVECKRKLSDLETKTDVLAGRVKSQQITQSSIDFY